MKNAELCIGILGGMGTYATIYAFQQYAQVFRATKEWERPRIIIDNRCTMPSRVKAYFGSEEERTIVADQMAEALINLYQIGCNKIVLACNTSHLYLPRIFDKFPQLKSIVVDIIDCCVTKILKDNRKDVFLLASEATIQSNIYGKYLDNRGGVKLTIPSSDNFIDIRKLIESVKQNNITSTDIELFKKIVNGYSNVILGCTELPVLWNRVVKCEINIGNNICYYDPVYLALDKIRSEYYD